MTIDRLSLISPSCDLRESYLAAMREMPEQEVNASLSYLSLKISDVKSDFQSFVNRLLRLEHSSDGGLVPAVTYWAVIDGNYVGRLSLRLFLNKMLSRMGGHVGYEVRPSERRKGYASELLRQAIDKARCFGLTRILVTCDETNIPSRRIIEKCGGEAIKPLDGEGVAPRKLRYWIPTVRPSARLREPIALTLSYLDSREARRDLERDPYWPKWDSPWWHMATLSEMGLGHRIPHSFLEFMAERLDVHYLHHFPLLESDLPAGIDPLRHILCHCALGTMVRILRENDIDILQALPWLEQWIERYHMDDGGFNCDEEAYGRPRPVSSLVSTLPMLELFFQLHMLRDMNLEKPLARGYDYLMAHRFVRSARNGGIIDDSWLLPIFPRFYKYDVLRALAFAIEYRTMTALTDNAEYLTEACEIVRRWFEGTQEVVPRLHTTDGSLLPAEEGSWRKGASTAFPLLLALAEKEEAMNFLALQWNRVQWLR
jgi:predicted acetyltransferase